MTTLPRLCVRKPDGSTFTLSDFRKKLNLVFIVLPELNEPVAQLIRHLAEKSVEGCENETPVIVVLRREQLAGVDVPPVLTVAADPIDRCFPKLGAASSAAIYFLDKFREVFHVYRGEALPTTDNILGWVRFIALQWAE